MVVTLTVVVSSGDGGGRVFLFLQNICANVAEAA